MMWWCGGVVMMVSKLIVGWVSIELSNLMITGQAGSLKLGHQCQGSTEGTGAWVSEAGCLKLGA